MVLPLKQKKPVSSRIIPLSCERDVLIWVAARFVHAMLKVSQERQEKKKTQTDWACSETLQRPHLMRTGNHQTMSALSERTRLAFLRLIPCGRLGVGDSPSVIRCVRRAVFTGTAAGRHGGRSTFSSGSAKTHRSKFSRGSLCCQKFNFDTEQKKAGNKHAFTFPHFAILHFAFLDLGTTGTAFCNLNPYLNHSFTLCANIHELIADDWLCSWENEIPWGWIKYSSLHSNMNVRLRDKRLSHGE